MTTTTQAIQIAHRRPTGARSFLARLVPKIIVVGVLLTGWQLAVGTVLPSFLPTPVGVIVAAPVTMASSGFLSALGETLLAVVVGTAIGALIGTVFGLMCGRLRWLRSLSSLYLEGLYALPLIALVPPVTIWLGYSTEARLALVTLAAFLPCAVSATDGARTLPANLIEVTRVYRSSGLRRFIDLVAPGSMPFIVAGLYVALGRAIIATVSVEFIAGLDGLGTYILFQARTYHQDDAFVAVAMLAILGVVARLAVILVLRRTAPWHTL